MDESHLELSYVGESLELVINEYYAPTKNTSILARIQSREIESENLFVVYASGWRDDGEVRYKFNEPIAILFKEEDLNKRTLSLARHYAKTEARRKGLSTCWDRTGEELTDLLA